MVREYAGVEAVCLGDDVPLLYGFKGWWSKIELFAPEHEDLRPCFYLDLDTFIRAPIHDFMEIPAELWLIRDLGAPKKSNSGLMKIPKYTDSIWTAAQKWRGEQVDGDFLSTQPHRILQDYHDGIVSYKYHCRELPRGRIVCFHGRPRPHETGGWVREHWIRHTQSRSLIG